MSDNILELVESVEAANVRLDTLADQLRGEVERLVASIDAGVPADTIAPAIRVREAETARRDAALRTPPASGSAECREAP